MKEKNILDWRPSSGKGTRRVVQLSWLFTHSFPTRHHTVFLLPFLIVPVLLFLPTSTLLPRHKTSKPPSVLSLTSPFLRQ